MKISTIQFTLFLAVGLASMLCFSSPVKSMLGAERTTDVEEQNHNPYVTDGLIAMWDGEWNVGWGEHDGTSLVWKDLVGRRDLLLTSVSSFEDNFLFVASPYGVAAEGTSLIEGLGQTEIVIKVDTYNKYLSNYYLYAGPGHAIGRRNMWLVNGIYHLDEYGNYSYGVQESADLRYITNISVFKYPKTQPGSGKIFKNGVDITTGTYSVDTESTLPSVVSLKAYYSDTRFYCIRVYNRALSAEEVAYNYAIDVERFYKE